MEAFHGASSSSSFLSSSNHRWTYHAFLSFRGKDTRKAFTAHLYEALRRNDINTFMDDKLRSGEEISPHFSKPLKSQRFQSLYSLKTTHHPDGAWTS
ncbi:hypothetical protein SLA2020_437480 [Shorea laevis]